MSSTIPPSVFAFVMYQIFNWKNYVWFAFFVNSIQFNTGYLASLLFNVLYPTSVTICTCYIWVYFIIIKRRSKNTLHHNTTSAGFFLYFTGTWIVFVTKIIKLSILRAEIATNWYDILCLSKTFLDRSTSSDDVNLDVPGYNLNRTDHPTNPKRDGVRIYFRNLLVWGY